MPNKRKVGTYWGPIIGVEPVSNELLRFLTPNAGSFVVADTMTKLRPPGPTPSRPYQKFLRWTQVGRERCAVTCESRAADAVPFDPEADAYYLIRRQDSGLLATPGGFIDAADQAEADGSAEETARVAAARELWEETGGSALQMVSLFPPVLESIGASSGQTSREVVTVAYPFGARMAMNHLRPADDAQQAPGEAGLLPGWYRFENIEAVIPQLHFAHHATILLRLATVRFGGGSTRATRLTANVQAKLTQLRTKLLNLMAIDYRELAQRGRAILLRDSSFAENAAKLDFAARIALGKDS